MQFLTDRKRAQGLGAGGTGTQHHWQMLVSSILMIAAVPLFIFTFGYGLGGSFEEVQAYFSRPLPAIIMGLSLIVITRHVMQETHEAIEDYVHGAAGKLLIVAVSAFAYTLIAAGLFALVKLAL
ncbi:succinate dehydrogenase, hydrophobic membrane anchor protein [Leisingera sp. S232]|uniref:succinate dehydrogenase, hydrophobic membrane anchor protein n=1 Tax=Leisingera sp. S232 TaxID=3415132 RepID=UPI00086D97BC|nr:succinate dehydrogenase, hydrophobic membrane anchor protein [Rhodobacteraceae bacterium (ex Bugula neritina AB1)]